MNYKHFGVMLDCSRNAVMKVEKLKYLIDCLQKMEYNTLELYMEDTYEIEGEPYFGYLRGRYSKNDIKEIDAYAKERGIELIPCIQTLGHFSNLVRHEVYQNIVDVNDIWLVGEPATYTLIEKIFKTLSENFTSRNVNMQRLLIWVMYCSWMNPKRMNLLKRYSSLCRKVFLRAM